MMQHAGPAGVVARWQPELDRLSPPTPHGRAHWRLVWEPGEVWSPVHRWTIWQCSPAYRAPFGIHDELRGPNPRNYGHYDTVLRRFVRTREFKITRAQWAFYQESGFYGKPVWVVQGERGGHLLRYSDMERSLSVMNGGPEQPPLMGDLPYAEPNRFTIDKLAGLDLARKFGDILRFYHDKPELTARLDFQDKCKAHEMARQLWRWMDAKYEAALTFTKKQADEVWDGASSSAPEPDFDKGYEDFLDRVADGAVT